MDQSPPTLLGTVPGDDATAASSCGVKLAASSDARSSAYFRTRTLVPEGSRPLTRTSAPLVVLVVAARTPDDGASANGAKLAISVNATAVSCWSGLTRYSVG